MRRIVVEPHADDAAISLAAHLRRWVDAGDAVTIVTVYGAETRLSEARAYAEAIGAEAVTLGVPEAGGGPGEGVAALDPDYLADALAIVGAGVTYWPLGVGHPEHAALAALAPAGAPRYVDKPYWYKASLADAFADALAGTTVVSADYAVRRLYRPAVAAYKTQARFFYFNPPSALAGPELVVSR